MNSTPIAYKSDERFQHTYVIGATGSGKSTLLLNLMAQDILHGYGIIVLSPENGLFDDLLSYIPASRKNDLIYLDPNDPTPPIIGFNPLSLEEGEDLNQKAGETMTTFVRVFGDLGVTMEPILDNATRALLQCPNSSVYDFKTLLSPTNPSLRRRIVTNRQIDPDTREFWEQYDADSYYKKSAMPVINRFNRLFRQPIGTILSTPSLSFKTVLNSRPHIILLNLSRLRGEQAEMTGQLILAQIQQALLTRNDIPERQRIPYYLYIDEFQTYAEHSGESLKNLFNGARKFKLAVTIAHQTTKDIPSTLLSTIIGNVGTTICRRLAAEDAPFFARQLQIKRPNSEAAAPEVLQNLTRADAYVSTPSHRIGVHVTIPRNQVVRRPAPIPKAELIALSKRNYGLIPATESAAVDADIQNEHITEPDTPPVPNPPPPKAKPKSTQGRRRTGFDDDKGSPDIEIEVL